MNNPSFRVCATGDIEDTEAGDLGPLKPSTGAVGTVVAVNHESGMLRVRGPSDGPDDANSGWWYPGPLVASRIVLAAVESAEVAPEAALALLEWAPAAAGVADSDGAEPVDLAASRPGCARVLEALLRVDPEAAERFDRKGEQSLLCAAAKAGSVEAVKALAALNPAALTTGCKGEGRLPLHWACDADRRGRPCTVEVVEALLGLAPEGAAAATDSSDDTPLVVALRTRAPRAVVEALLAAPGGAASAARPGRSNRLPLHVCCEWNGEPAEGRTLAETEADVSASIAALLAAHPEGALHQETEGLTPLALLLCQRQGVPAAVGRVALSLLAAAPAAAAVRCSDGWFPVLYAVRFGAPPDVVRAALAAHPQAAAEHVDGDIESLFGAALQWGRAPPDVLADILAAHPGAAALPDASGALPLHTALVWRLPAGLLAALVEAHPEGARARLRGTDGEECTFPLHFAVATGTLEVVEMLLRAHPEAVALQDERGCGGGG